MTADGNGAVQNVSPPQAGRILDDVLGSGKSFAWLKFIEMEPAGRTQVLEGQIEKLPGGAGQRHDNSVKTAIKSG